MMSDRVVINKREREKKIKKNKKIYIYIPLNFLCNEKEKKSDIFVEPEGNHLYNSKKYKFVSK